MDPLFSILIANYNNGRYLLDAIESVRSQDYSNWEIILVDDCSTDNSKLIYKQLLHDHRIKIYYNNENKGCAYTKHQCVLRSNGIYCGFLDPDDILLPNAISIMVKNISLEDNVSLVFSRFYFCDEKLNIIRESRLLCLNNISYFENRDYQPEVFAAFARDKYMLMGGINTNNLAAVDQDLYFRLEEVGTIKIVNEFTYKYRSNPTSLTSFPMYTYYWNIIVRHETALRRKLNPSYYSFNDFKNYINEIVEHRAFLKEIKVRNSISYKIGNILLSPLKYIKKIIRK